MTSPSGQLDNYDASSPRRRREVVPVQCGGERTLGLNSFTRLTFDEPEKRCASALQKRRALTPIGRAATLAGSGHVKEAHLVLRPADSPVPRSDAEERERNKAVVRRLFDGLYAEHNPDVIDEVASPSFSGSIPSRAFDTRDAWRAYNVASLGAFPDLTCTLHDLVAEADRVVARWTLAGTQLGDYGPIQATGKQIEIDGVFVCRVIDGLIVNSWGFWDTASVLRQLGVSRG